MWLYQIISVLKLNEAYELLIEFYIWNKVCKVNYGVGLVFSLVWLLLGLVRHTIISTQMMLDLCGIDCQSVYVPLMHSSLGNFIFLIFFLGFCFNKFFNCGMYRWLLHSHRSWQYLSLKELMSRREWSPSYHCCWQV